MLLFKNVDKIIYENSFRKFSTCKYNNMFFFRKFSQNGLF